MTFLLPSAFCPLPSETSVLPSAFPASLLPSLDIQSLAQTELNNLLANQSQESAQYEIDSVEDIFGTLYRVWGGNKGINLLGTFYQNLDGFWISQPCNSDERLPWHSDTQAINAILAA